MERALECLPQGSRVAVIRLRSLGDCVLTTPALDILKRFRSDLRVGICVEPRFRDLFAGNPDVDAMYFRDIFGRVPDDAKPYMSKGPTGFGARTTRPPKASPIA